MIKLDFIKQFLMKILGFFSGIIMSLFLSCCLRKIRGKKSSKYFQMHIYKRSCLSVRPSVRYSVGASVGYFRTLKIVISEGRKFSNDKINNDTMSDDEIVASYEPPRYLFSSVSLRSNQRKTQKKQPSNHSLSHERGGEQSE